VAPEAVGLGAGAGAGVLTANPIVGVAVAIGARFTTAEGIGYVKNGQRRQVQGAIATAAGNTADNAPVRWSTEPNAFYRAVFGTVAGYVQVVRDFGGRIHCREILYTVEDDGDGIEELVDSGAEVQSADAAVPNFDGGSSEKPQQTTSDWPEASGPILAAVICKNSFGWQWAVSEPTAQAW
jgi:hypothetical protein